MKTLILLLLTSFAFGATAFSNENSLIVNSSSQPIPTAPYPGYRFIMSTAKEASHVIAASPANLVWLIVSSDSSQWILIMDSPTVPSDGAVTLLCPPINVGANTTTMIVFPSPLRGQTGISVSNSNANSFTKAIGSSTCIFSAKYQ